MLIIRDGCSVDLVRHVDEIPFIGSCGHTNGHEVYAPEVTLFTSVHHPLLLSGVLPLINHRGA